MPAASPRRSLATALACTLLAAGLAAGLNAAGEPEGKARPGLPSTPASGRWRQHDIRRPRPPAVEPAEASVASEPPADAVVLFDGSGLDAWQAPGGGPARWRVGDGVLETAPGAGPIRTKGEFGDIQLHVEWSAPSPPRGKGQDRGNSGIFLMGQFEIQVLDSHESDTYADGQAGAIYGQYPPLANASRPPGEWQAYDIAFRRPRFDASGGLVEPARITVFHNGVLVQNNEEPIGPTSWLEALPYAEAGGRGPISLQDHDHPVRFRNIWLRELPERPAPTAADLARPAIVSLPAETLDRYAGTYRMGREPGAATAEITREGDHLTVSFSFLPRPLTMEPVAEAEFLMPRTDGRFTFRRDEEGRVTGVLFRIGDGERMLDRVAP